jgi:TRAP-type C4-dicarboxylate transport system permease small subunit
LETGGRLVMGVMLAVLFIAGIKVTVVAHDQQSPALGMPMSYVYLALPVGAALMLWELLIQSLNPREVPASSGG